MRTRKPLLAIQFLTTALVVACTTPAIGDESKWTTFLSLRSGTANTGVVDTARPLTPTFQDNLQRDASSRRDNTNKDADSVEDQRETEADGSPNRDTPTDDIPGDSVEAERQSGSDAFQFDGLTLEELQSYALTSNPGIQRASAFVQAARGRALQVGLKPNPEVGIDFQQLGSNGQAEQYGITLAQRIVRSEKLELSRSAEMHEVRRLQQQLIVQQQRVLTDVHVAYLRVLRAQRQIDVTRELVKIGQQALSLSEQLFEAEEVAKTDVLQAELEVATADLQLQDAENSHDAAWRQLEAITGQPAIPVQPLHGSLFEARSPIDFDSVLATLRAQSPEVASMMSAIESARCRLRRAQVEPLPDVSIGGLLNWRDNGVGGRANAGLAVSIPLPIRDRNQGAIHEARFQMVAAERDLERLYLALAARLTPVLQRYTTARQRAERFREHIIPKSTESLALVRDAYELGETAFSSLLTAQRTYAQTRLSYIDSLETLRTAEAVINGLLLTDSLQ